MKRSTLASILSGIALLSGLACAFAGLLMLAWNIVGVAALSIAAPLSFLTALKGVAIFCGVVVLVNIIRSMVQVYIQKAQMKMLYKLEKEAEKAQEDDDLLRHFRPS